MKKSVLFLLILIAIISFGAYFYFKPKKTNEIVLKFYDNTSTGSYWQEKVDTEGIVAISKTSDYSNCPKDVDGCSGHIIYTIKPLSEGRVKATFEWKRYNGDTAKRSTYDIVVTKDLEISETHSESLY